MNTMSNDHTDSLQKQAADWQATLASGTVSAAQSQAFQAWLQDPEHELAYSQCLLVLEMSDNLKTDDDIQRELRALSDSAIHNSANDQRWYQKPKRLAQIAASLILAVGLAIAFDYQSYQHYSTGVGEQRLVRLDDGSSILLNTDTRLKVKYTSSDRSITLAYGEAYFNVAKDRDRPFEVHAGTSTARALGTQFSVALLDQSQNKKVSVAVTEGLVEVEANTATEKSTVIAQLGVGDAINFNNKALEHNPKVSSANLARIDAWQQRKIYFNSDTLLDAVTEYNRYSQVKFHIIDQELGDERITGLFNVGDLDAFIYSLEQLLNINVVKSGERIFLIKKT